VKISGGTSVGKATKVAIPLPVFGVRADVLVAPKLYLREKFDFLYYFVFYGASFEPGRSHTRGNTIPRHETRRLMNKFGGDAFRTPR
jgi:hypothetical protein